MTSPLEHNSKPATLVFSGNVARVMANGAIVPLGSMVTVCCYCDRDKTITNELLDAGYKTTHGACESCAKRELEAWQTTRQEIKNLQQITN